MPRLLRCPTAQRAGSPFALFSLLIAATAALVWCTASSAADAATPATVLPPINQPPTQDQLPGKIVWHDLVTPNLDLAKHFYGTLFGWTYQDIARSGSLYTVAYSEGQPVAGLGQPTDRANGRRPMWITYLSVASVANARSQIEAGGGHVLYGPRRFPDRGTQAVSVDPNGAIFGVMRSTSGDPPDMLADPGQWIWSALLATDPGPEAGFYQNLCGFEVYPSEERQDHLILASGDYARASVNRLWAGAAVPHPHWLPFLRVDNVDKTVAEATAEGGRVLVAPHTDPRGQKVALLSDPTGAPVGIMEWNDASAEGGPK